MIHRFRFRAWPALLFSCAAVFFETAVLAAGQSQTAPPRKDAAPEMPSHAQPADVSGDWKASWRGRLGTEPGTLHFQEDGTKLSGTFKDLHGLSSLSGTVDRNQISIDVQFQGPHPFTTRFTGNGNGNKIEGISEAIGVAGGGAYLGHGGEIVHPEHPWTANRVANQPTPAGQPGPNSGSSPPARN